MIVVAVDPGTEQSALVAFDGERVLEHYTVSNGNLWVNILRDWSHRADQVSLAIESIESFGMPVGAEVFRTVRYTGFIQGKWHPRPTYWIPRRVVKQHLCYSARATDGNIRQALIDRFGPTKEKAVGVKKAPGPLFGVKGHEYAALAVAVTAWDQQVWNAVAGIHTSEF